MKIFLLTATYLVGIGELILAIYFWATNSRNEIRRVMALLALSTAGWVITNVYTAYMIQTAFLFFVNGLSYLFGVLLLTSLLHLVLIHPYPMFPVNKFHKWLFYVPAALLSILSFIPHAVVEGVVGDPQHSGYITGGPVLPVYNLYLIFLYITCIIVLTLRLKRLNGPQRNNTLIFLVALLVGGLPAVYSDLLAPLYTTQPNFLYGCIFSGVWLGAVVYLNKQKDMRNFLPNNLFNRFKDKTPEIFFVFQ